MLPINQCCICYETSQCNLKVVLMDSKDTVCTCKYDVQLWIWQLSLHPFYDDSYWCLEESIQLEPIRLLLKHWSCLSYMSWQGYNPTKAMFTNYITVDCINFKPFLRGKCCPYGIKSTITIAFNWRCFFIIHGYLVCLN